MENVQVVADRRAAAGADGQRDQELLEHAHQAQAHRPRHRPTDAPAGECRRRCSRPRRRRFRRRAKQPSPTWRRQGGDGGAVQRLQLARQQR